MILKALYDYYNKHPELPRPGFEDKELKYFIVIKEDGTFDRLESLVTDLKKKTGQFFSVPKGEIRTSGILPYLLWDNYGYVLGYALPEKAKKQSNKEAVQKKNEENKKKAIEKKKAFVEKLQSLPEELQQTREIKAILEFYRKGEESKVFESPEWENCTKFPSCNLSFRISDQIEPVFSQQAIKDFVASTAAEEPDKKTPIGCCLITGKHLPLSRLMSATAIPGGKSTAALVSFQVNSGYDSYGKEQCFNAPISQEAEFACSTALKALLSKESKNKFSLGDTTAVFWVEKQLASFALELLIPALAQNSKEHAVENVAAMQKLCEAAYSGKLPAEDRNIRYYFLGLAPNAARICVRFWKSGTVGELAVNIAQHFKDLMICNGRDYPALVSLLSCVVLDNKMDNVPPNLNGRMFEAIFNGTGYPETWRNLCLQRIRIDGGVSPLRAAILKAYINRKTRLQHLETINKEITMNYDPDNPSTAYQCGALFALLVKAQEEANPGLNATISDRYFSSASTRPSSVFNTLLKLNRAHLKKLNTGRVVYFERQIGEISVKLGAQFPAYFPPDDQGRFCLGYYQKRQELFTKKEETTNQGE